MPSPDRLLVVDDDPLMRKYLARVLARAGYSADFAEDGAAAIAALQAQPYAVVLTDCQMPGKNGLEVAQAAKRQWPSCKVVLMSSTPHADAVHFLEQALEAGADVALRKPVTAAEVLAAIHRMFRLTASSTAPVQKRH